MDPSPFARKSALPRSPVAASSAPQAAFDFTPLPPAAPASSAVVSSSTAAVPLDSNDASSSSTSESRPKAVVKRLVPKPRFTASAAATAADSTTDTGAPPTSSSSSSTAPSTNGNHASSSDDTTPPPSSSASSSQKAESFVVEPAPRARPPFPVAVVKKAVPLPTKMKVQAATDADIMQDVMAMPTRGRSSTAFIPDRTPASARPTPAAAAAAAAASSSAAASTDPVDISDKITEALISRLADDQWKLRAVAMEEIHSMLKSAKHRIVLTRDGGLFETLKLRLVDNNKNLARDALILLQQLTTDIGAPIVKQHQKLIPPILVSIGDSKTFVRAEAQKCLDQMIDLGGLQMILRYLPKTLEPSHVGRKEILDLLATRLPLGPQRSLDNVAKFDINELILPVLNLCVDKQGDVRSSAEKVLEFMIGHVGFDPVLEQTKEMKKALVLQIMPMMEKCRASAAASNSLATSSAAADKLTPTASNDEEFHARPSTAPAKKTTLKKPVAATTSSGASTARAATTTQAAAPPAEVAPPEDVKPKTFLKAKSRQSTLPAPVKKPTTTAATAASAEESEEDEPPPPPPQSHGILKKAADSVAKRARLQKQAKRVAGVYRELSKDEIDELELVMSGLLVDDLYAQLMHKDFQKQVSGLEAIEKELNDSTSTTCGYDGVASVSDLLLKYFSYRLCGDANSVVLGKILTLLIKLFSLHESNSYKLTEVEAASILPTLIEKTLGHNTLRFRNDTRDILLVHCAAIHPTQKIMTYILQGYDSKNKRVQCECLELSGTVLSKHGLSGTAATQVCDVKKIIPQIGNLVGASDGGIRTAALNALSTIYAVCGEELWTLLGRGLPKEKQLVPQKSIAMIEQRFKGIKAGSGVATPDEELPPQSAPALTSQSSTGSSGIPSLGAATGTPRKSMLPGPASSTVSASTSSVVPSGVPSGLLRKKSSLPTVGGTTAAASTSIPVASNATPPFRPRAQTMRAAQFAQAKAEYEQDESFNEPPQSKPLMAHTPIKAAPTTALEKPARHTRFHSAGELEEFEDLDADDGDLDPFPRSQTSGNLPGCFSLDVDVESTSSGTATPNRLAFASPARMDHTAPTGVAQSSHLSDTLIVLMEPSIPTNERIEALQRMEQLISSQGKRSISEGDEESLVQVLLQELSNSFVIYATTGLVKLQPAYNASALAAIRALVTSVDIMELLPQQLTGHLLEFLFAQLSDQRVLRSPACTNLVRECDRIILRALECMPRTRAFCTVIDVLQGAMTTPTRKLQIPIIAKCLTKLLTAYVKNGSTPKLDLDEILGVLKDFTDVISPADTTHDNDAMKSVLSVLHEVVTSRASEVRQKIRRFDQQSVLAQYVMQLLSSEEEEATPPNRTPSQSPPPQQQTTPQGRVRSNTLHGNSGIPMPTSSLPSSLSFSSAALPSSASFSVSSIPSSSGIPFPSPTPSPSSIPTSVNSTPQPYEGRGRAMTTTASPAGTPSSYREQLELLKAKAASFTSPIPSQQQQQSTPQATTPTHADSSNSTSNTAAAAAPKPSSLEAIRARFKTLNPRDDNGPTPSTISSSLPTSASFSTAPSTTAPAQSSGSSSLLALRAKVATMNNKLGAK